MSTFKLQLREDRPATIQEHRELRDYIAKLESMLDAERMTVRILQQKITEHNAVIEQCAAVVDECNHEGPYMAIGAAKRIRALKAI